MRLKAGIEAPRFPRKKVRGKLHGNAGTVTACAVSVDTTTVRQARQAFECLSDDTVRRRGVEVSHKSHATCVVFFTQIKAAKAFASHFFIHKAEFRHYSFDQPDYFLSSGRVLRNE